MFLGVNQSIELYNKASSLSIIYNKICTLANSSKVNKNTQTYIPRA